MTLRSTNLSNRVQSLSIVVDENTSLNDYTVAAADWSLEAEISKKITVFSFQMVRLRL
jgi:hypothetical protein